jgi:hypothetical protein
MSNLHNIHISDYTNLLASKESVSLDEYWETYKRQITQESEQLFVRNFLYPLFGEKNIKYVVPQHSLIRKAERGA